MSVLQKRPNFFKLTIGNSSDRVSFDKVMD